MGDAEEPAAEFPVITQAPDMFDGSEKRFLHEVEAGLLAVHKLKNVNIKGHLIPPEEGVPGSRISGASLRHRQLFGSGHVQHIHPVECTRREKVQSGQRFDPAPPEENSRPADFQDC
jgi:hypothetical protein